MDISEFQDLTSISHAALRVLQEEGITIPKPVMIARCPLAKETEECCDIFGVPLIHTEDKEDVCVDGGVSCSLPKFIANSLLYLEEYVSTEGLFRKSGSVARQRQIRVSDW